MVEKLNGFIGATEIFDVEAQDFLEKRKYESVKALIDFSEELVSKTSSVCDAFGPGMVALGLTDMIAAQVEDPEKVFGEMLTFFEENGITTDVQTESPRYKSAVCLSVYLEKRLVANSEPV